ncbi:epoxide hydrolase-like protein [Xylariaceae sp. FL1272]|nr:epoxide hydrolase-like protein [Xylariaceae sp. FL1272]
MEKLPKKTFTTSRGYTYAYYIHKPTSATKPALAFCHGWPDHALMWNDIATALLDSGHPIVAADMLGYDGTSKPTDPHEYRSKALADDLYEVFDAEGLDKIIPVGHDWGSWMAQRLYIWRPERCAGLILLSAPYGPAQVKPNDAPAPFDLQVMNAAAEKAWGYPALAYWQLFGVDEDGPQVLRDNVETLYHLLHWDDPDAMMKALCVHGATRELVTTGKPEDFPLKEYARKPGVKEAWINRMSRDGFEAPQCWYKSTLKNHQSESEKELPPENIFIKDPCLYISGTRDSVCRTDGMERVKTLVPDLTTLVLEGNHWILLDRANETRERIVSWLADKYPA